MNYYQHHIGDYAAATAYLSLVEDAIYTRLLRVYYRDEKPLPANSASIAWLIGLRTRKEKDALERMLPQFFKLHDDGWHNMRADEEIAAYHGKAETARENGKSGGRPKKDVPLPSSKPGDNPKQNPNKTQTKPSNNPEQTQTKPSNNPEQTQTKANQEPITNNQEPIKATATAKAWSSPSSDNLQTTELLQDSDCLRTNCAKNAQSALTKTDSENFTLPEKTQTKSRSKPKPKSETAHAVNPLFLKPEGVTDRTWGDFITLRKAKRAPPTETAISGIRREAEKAGVSMQTAIEICCAQGWQGFNAEWYANLNRSNAKRRNDPEDIYEHNRKVGEAWLAEQQRNPAPLITGHSLIYDPLADAARRRGQVLPALTNGVHHA